MTEPTKNEIRKAWKPYWEEHEEPSPLVSPYAAIAVLLDRIDAAERRCSEAESRATGFQWVLEKIRKHWSGYKSCGREEIQEVQGAMHVLVSHAEGYERYITAYKCDDKQGEIARQSVRIAELEEENRRLRAATEAG